MNFQLGCLPVILRHGLLAISIDAFSSILECAYPGPKWQLSPTCPTKGRHLAKSKYLFVV